MIPSDSATSLPAFEKKSLFRKNSLHTLTESALYSPVDDPEVFVGFGFAALIFVSTARHKVNRDAGGEVLGKSLRSRAVTVVTPLIRSITVVKLFAGPDKRRPAC